LKSASSVLWGWTTPRCASPSRLAEHLALGYQYRDGVFEARPFEFVPAAPAGSMSASAVDIAKFMIAQLELGR
jgi:hypothetical protein